MRFLLIPLLCISGALFCQPAIELVEFSDGFAEPVDITNAGDWRLFIVEREGYIKIVDTLGNPFPDNFLDIHTQVESGYQEQGLLGLAFHPDYAVNGYFFVHYSDLDGNTVVSRFTVSTFDADIADPTTEEIIYTAVQPFVNHNGGCLKFGPDGYLYIGLGDGGSAGDPGDRAQNPENKLGKMHRIDVNGVLPYTLPPDNPFIDATDTLPEIWSIGYRNPWRYSFDRLTGDLWVADVGQNLSEEVDFEPAGSEGGLNYGWRCYEANDVFNDVGCDGDTAYTFPILDYPHNFSTGGFSVTGGYVYRGIEYPGMYGYYLCADYVSGNWWWIYPGVPGGWMNERMDDVKADISTFGQDLDGELYCADLNTGQIFHITDACGDFVINATATDYICGVQDATIDLTITDAVAPYEIDWSTGSTEEDLSGLTAGGVYAVTVTDDSGCERVLDVLINEIPPFTASIFFDGEILTTDAGISWQWYLNGELIAGATDMSYTPAEDGIYSVLATDANGCSVMSEEIEIIVSAIHSADLILSADIYPNPATNYFMLVVHSAMQTGEVEIKISDLLHQTVLASNMILVSGSNNKEINISDLASGIYLVTMNSDHILFQKTIVVAKN